MIWNLVQLVRFAHLSLLLQFALERNISNGCKGYQ